METISDVLTWVPFRGPAADAFLLFLGVDAGDPPRILAAMSEDMVQALVQQVTYEFENEPYVHALTCRHRPGYDGTPHCSTQVRPHRQRRGPCRSEEGGVVAEASQAGD